MDQKLEYAFDDEPVIRFCYDLLQKKIEIHFQGYCDLNANVYVNTPCIWVIENWEYAKSRIGDEQRLYDFNRNIGIFSLILDIKYNDVKELEVLVITIDENCVTFFFKDPKLSLRQIK